MLRFGGCQTDAPVSRFVRFQVLTPEHFELREALLSEEDQLRLKARNDAEARVARGALRAQPAVWS